VLCVFIIGLVYTQKKIVSWSWIEQHNPIFKLGQKCWISRHFLWAAPTLLQLWYSRKSNSQFLCWRHVPSPLTMLLAALFPFNMPRNQASLFKKWMLLRHCVMIFQKQDRESSWACKFGCTFSTRWHGQFGLFLASRASLPMNESLQLMFHVL